MPYLKKPQKKKRDKRIQYFDEVNFYNTTRWIKLRDWMRAYHPLCQLCLLQNKTVPMVEVHHIVPIKTGRSNYEKELLAYDPSNLVSLCERCHDGVHVLLRKKPEEYKKLFLSIS